jgi:hypothetical protein
MLEEIVILHIKNGSDYFCILSGTLDASNLSQMRKDIQQRKKKKVRGLGRSEKKKLETRKKIESMSISAPTNVVKLSSSSFSPANSQHNSRELQPDVLSQASAAAQAEHMTTVFANMVPFATPPAAVGQRQGTGEVYDSSSDDEDDEDFEEEEDTRNAMVKKSLVEVEEDSDD